MSATAAPFGLRPVFRLGGSPVPEPQALAVLSTYAANIYQGAPVKIGTNGFLELAAINDRFVGSFAGVEYTPTNGRRVYSNFWPTGTVATEIEAYYQLDPWLIYEVQANAAVTQLMIGQQFDLTTTSTGSAVTGLSTAALDVASSAANAGVQVIGLSRYVDNAWGDAFTIVQVRISEHQYAADIAAF